MVLALAFSAMAETTIGKNKELLVNGKPFFPLFIWAQPANLVKFWKDLGVNAIVWGDNKNPKEFLDECRKNGIYGILDFDQKVMNHPGLLLWKIGDEPDMKKDRTSGQIEKTYKNIKRADGKHPVWVNFSPRFFPAYEKMFHWPLKEYYATAAIVDIVGYDHYPVTGWNKPERIPEIAAMTKMLREDYAKDRIPVFTIVEVADQDLDWTPPETRGPTAVEMRVQIWMGIISGSKGIGYFSVSFTPKFKWNNMNSEQTAELKRSNKQISAFSEVLCTGDSLLKVDKDNEKINILVKEFKDKIYIFAVSLSNSKEKVKLNLPELKEGKAEVYDEGRSIDLKDSILSDTFDKHGVHIYIIDKSR